MKKIMSICLCLLLVGCSSNSKIEKYENEMNELKLEIDSLSEKNEKLEEQIKGVKVQLDQAEKKLSKKSNFRISGGFVATLRHLMPDYGCDDRVLGIAVVSWFQGDTFVVRIDSEIANKLEIGKSYYFEIEEKTIENTTLEEVSQLVYTAQSYTKVIGYREPKENEIGIESTRITIEVIQ